MDREQEEMQFLGLFGIYAESCKLLFRYRKIFSKITLTLILPLSFIFLAQEKISYFLYWRIRYTEFRLHRTKAGTPKFNHISDLLSSEWVFFILFKTAYFTILLLLSLLSTSAVVYAIACVYTSREITFKKIMSVVPRVWKRLMITFFCVFFAFFVYNIAFGLTMMLWDVTVSEIDIFGPIVFLIVLILYCIGFIYMTIIWQLASVVSVLEDSYGVSAMMKSKKLIKGKMFITIVIFFKLNLSLFIINMVFKEFIVYRWRWEASLKMIVYGVLCLLLLLKLIVFALVVQTVIYFVCKSYHHENIDKSALSDHLEAYLGEYVPLMEKNVQLEEYRVGSDDPF